MKIQSTRNLILSNSSNAENQSVKNEWLVAKVGQSFDEKKTFVYNCGVLNFGLVDLSSKKKYSSKTLFSR